MGGRPITALAHVCFPPKGELEILERVLAGGLSKMMEAGCAVIGGHSVRDEEMKFGYSVTGLIDPKKVFANDGARAGDRLIFTKALGTGVICTAIKKGQAKQEWIDAAITSMTTLNKKAADVIANCPVHTMTDVTGFGLVAHAREMALASKVSMRLFASRIPIIDGALDCIRAGHIPAGLVSNREFAECVVGYEDGVSEEVKALLFDPQTAGGLLISVENSMELVDALNQAGVPAVEIGEVIPASKPLIHVVA
jgi:selenide,water dikinase